MSGPQFLEPLEERNTKWSNPLNVDQHVDVFEGDSRRPTRYRFAPGETKEIPSRYDNVVHRVHNGVIIGGSAPQLVKVGSNEKLDDALNTQLQEELTAKAALAAAAEQQRQAQETAALAIGKLADAKKK